MSCERATRTSFRYPFGCRRVQALATLVLVASGSGVGAHPEDRPSLSEPREFDLEPLMWILVETVSSASKHQERTSEAPSSVRILAAEDIHRHGYRMLGGIPNGGPGIHVTTDRTQGSLGVRGFNRPDDCGGRNLLLLDGHPLNEAPFDSTPFARDVVLDDELAVGGEPSVPVARIPQPGRSLWLMLNYRF